MTDKDVIKASLSLKILRGLSQILKSFNNLNFDYLVELSC